MTRRTIVSVRGVLIAARVSEENFISGVFGSPINYARDMRQFREKVAKATRANAPLGDARNYGSNYHAAAGSTPGTLKESVEEYESATLRSAETRGTASRALVGVRVNATYAGYVEDGTTMGGSHYAYSWAKDAKNPGVAKWPRATAGQKGQKFMLRAWLQSGGVGSATTRAARSSFGGLR